MVDEQELLEEHRLNVPPNRGARGTHTQGQRSPAVEFDSVVVFLCRSLARSLLILHVAHGVGAVSY